MSPKVSICIPYHDTPQTAFFLSRLLSSIHTQTFRDYEIILTNEGGMAHNHNAAVLKAKGDIIHMMQMDDYFAHPDALRDIVEGFNRVPYNWQICASLHNSDGTIGTEHQPSWTKDIYTGNNRLGSISTLSMRRERALLFEEPLEWLIDVDLYYRLYLKYGPPQILKTPAVVIDTRNDRMSHTIPEEKKLMEIEYLKSKYHHA